MIRINTNRKIVLPELSYRIMGVLFKVHNILGSTLLEKYYQRAVAKEFENQKLSFEREKSIMLQYEGANIGKYFLDFIVERNIVLELKAHRFSDPRFFKQTLAYLKTVNLPLAILANFRREKLESKRIINNQFVSIRE